MIGLPGCKPTTSQGIPALGHYHSGSNVDTDAKPGGVSKQTPGFRCGSQMWLSGVQEVVCVCASLGDLGNRATSRQMFADPK